MPLELEIDRELKRLEGLIAGLTRRIDGLGTGTTITLKEAGVSRGNLGVIDFLDGFDVNASGEVSLDSAETPFSLFPQKAAAETISGAWTIPTGSGATFVVAATDASLRVKRQADYVCDGTADDVQIQAALNALGVSIGGKVILSEGTFTLAATVTFPTGGRVLLKGSGRGTVVRNASGGLSPWFQIFGTGTSSASHAKGVVIEDIRFAAQGGRTDANKVLHLKWVDNSQILRCSFQDIRGIAIHGQEWWDSDVMMCIWDSCGDPGAALAPVIKLESDGVADDDSNNIRFYGCRNEHYYYTAFQGLGKVSGIHWTSCKFEHSDTTGVRHAIEFDATGESVSKPNRRHHILDCMVDASTANGDAIRLVNGVDEMVIGNCRLQGNASSGNGIYMSTGQREIQVGNCFIKGFSRGVNITADCDRIRLANVTVDGCANEGFLIDNTGGDCYGVQLTNCTARENGLEGFKTTSTRTQFTGCTAEANGNTTASAGFQVNGNDGQLVACEAYDFQTPKTQTYGIAGSGNNMVLVGNKAKAADHLTGAYNVTGSTQPEIAVKVPLKKPLPGIANDAAAVPATAPFPFMGRRLKATARANLGTTATFRVTVAGTDRGSVTINSGASVGTADVTDFLVAEGDEIDVDETAGGTDDVAVVVSVIGAALT